MFWFPKKKTHFVDRVTTSQGPVQGQRLDLIFRPNIFRLTQRRLVDISTTRFPEPSGDTMEADCDRFRVKSCFLLTKTINCYLKFFGFNSRNFLRMLTITNHLSANLSCFGLVSGRLHSPHQSSIAKVQVLPMEVFLLESKENFPVRLFPPNSNKLQDEADFPCSGHRRCLKLEESRNRSETIRRVERNGQALKSHPESNRVCIRCTIPGKLF